MTSSTIRRSGSAVRLPPRRRWSMAPPPIPFSGTPATTPPDRSARARPRESIRRRPFPTARRPTNKAFAGSCRTSPRSPRPPTQPSDPNASASYAALNSRINTALAVPTGVQNITDIEASLANAQTAMAAAKSQHQQTSTMLQNMLQVDRGRRSEPGRGGDFVVTDQPVGIAVDDGANGAAQSSDLSLARLGIIGRHAPRPIKKTAAKPRSFSYL